MLHPDWTLLSHDFEIIGLQQRKSNVNFELSCCISVITCYLGLINVKRFWFSESLLLP